MLLNLETKVQMSVDIQLRGELLPLLVQLLLFHGPMELITEARGSDHWVEHFQVFCIDSLLFEQSLVQMILDSELLIQWLEDISFESLQFLGRIEEILICVLQFLL